MLANLTWAMALGLVAAEEGFVALFDLGETARFIGLSILLLGYVAVEANRVRHENPRRWLLDPPVLCSVGLFVLCFGLTNAVYFLPIGTLWQLGVTTEITPWMNRFMLMTIVAAMAMWTGYRSWLGSWMAASLSRNAWLGDFLRSDFAPRRGILVILVGIGLAARLVSIWRGVYWYASDPLSVREAASYINYLVILQGASGVALTIAALQYFAPGSGGRGASWVFGLLLLEMGFGMLSGMKAQVVGPLLNIAVCQYYQTGKIPWKAVAIFPLVVALAYAVVEPYRYARYHDTQFNARSFEDLVRTVAGADRAENLGPSLDEPPPGTLVSSMSRMNMTYIGSLGIEYADTRLLPEGSPDFLGDLVKAPAYAVIPRALWEGKEVMRHGQWYLQVVMGSPIETSSVGMSPVTYLYFAGGMVAIVGGFYLLGVLQRPVSAIALSREEGGAALMYFFLLGAVTNIESVFYSVIVTFIRTIPAALTAQLVLYRRR